MDDIKVYISCGFSYYIDSLLYYKFINKKTL